MKVAGLEGSFVKLDRTSDDVSLAVNGVHIIRVTNTRIGSLPIELARPEIADRLASAVNNYSNDKVAILLQYSSNIDYRLPEILQGKEPKRKLNPYYVYYCVMGMPAEEFRLRASGLSADATPETILEKKKDVITKICLENGVAEIALPHRYGFKRLKREIENVSAPLIQIFKEKVPGDVLETLVDSIAQRFTPASVEVIQKATQRMAAIFNEMYSKSRHYGVLMPKDEQLITFFSQIAERVFGEKTSPLEMFIVSCPRYGEHDEYDTLEEGLSQSARTYLYSLPLFTTIFAENGIPYKGHILVNDTEEHMAEGSLLERLGLTKETYRAKCRGNVEAVDKAMTEEERMTNVTTHLFTEVFPEFISVTANLERQLYQLTQNDAKLRLEMAKVADSRLPRHTKIMGGTCDFSDSLYLAIHYSAEYMALGYLCRLHPELSRDSFIVNYNSPNVEQFNSRELLVQCTHGDTVLNNVRTIPVFQVKFY